MAGIQDPRSGLEQTIRFDLNLSEDNEKKTEEKASTAGDETASPPPTCVIVLGMAGSGKTTFVQRLVSHLHTEKKPPYVVNLDPACAEVPFPANIDVRDTVNYKEVMKQYGLGPNGGIVTSLNLFATKFDQVLNLIERKTKNNTTVESEKVTSASSSDPGGAASSAPPLQQEPESPSGGASVGGSSLPLPRCIRHSGPDRGFHLVGLGQHHHRSLGGSVPHSRRLRHGRCQIYEPGDFHVQYAVRL